MGGNAFPGAATPRMDPQVYAAMKSRAQEALRAYFRLVTTPIEAPGKATYGDVDVMACLPKEAAADGLKETSKVWTYSTQAVGDLIGALRGQRVGKLDSWNFLVPWPKDLKPNDASNENGENQYIQVDIEICSTREEYKWHEFLHAHGDFWNVIGHMLRKFDITATDKGLILVIPEVAGVHKTLSRVFATQDPSVVMKYLGFDEERFWQPFEKWDDVCAFIASCRFHDPGRNRHRYESTNTSNDATSPAITPDGTSTPQSGNAPASIATDAITNLLGDLQLNKSDRDRYKKRPMLKYWFDVYRPAHLDDSPGSASHFKEEEVYQDATAFFGDEFATRYEQQKHEGLKFGFEAKFWEHSRKFVKSQTEDSAEVTYATKGLKRLLTQEPSDSGWREIEGLSDARISFNKFDFDGLMLWWKVKWASVAAHQKEIDRLKSAEVYKAMKIREAEQAAAAAAGGEGNGNDDARDAE